MLQSRRPRALGILRPSCGVLSLLAGLFGCGDGDSATADVVLEPAPLQMPAPPPGDVPVEPTQPAVEMPAAVDAPAEASPVDESTPLEAAPAADETGAVAPGAPLLGEAESADWPVPVLAWQPCGNGIECADALVPRDYADPEGPKYRVAVARRRRASPSSASAPCSSTSAGPEAAPSAASVAGPGASQTRTCCSI